MTDSLELVVQYMMALATGKRPRINAHGGELFVEITGGEVASDDEMAEAIRWFTRAFVSANEGGFSDRACTQTYGHLPDQVFGMLQSLLRPDGVLGKVPDGLKGRLAGMLLKEEGRDRLLGLINADLMERATAATRTGDVVTVRVGDQIIAAVREPLPKSVVEAFRKAVDEGRKHVRIEIQNGDAVVVWDE